MAGVGRGERGLEVFEGYCCTLMSGVLIAELLLEQADFCAVTRDARPRPPAFLPVVRSQDIIRQADEVNRIPLPPIPDDFGVRLPPLQYQTTLPNLQWDAEVDALPDQEARPVRPQQLTQHRCRVGVVEARESHRRLLVCFFCRL